MISPRRKKKNTEGKSAESTEKNPLYAKKISIFRLKIYICSLKIRIFSLKICIFNLKIDFFRRASCFFSPCHDFSHRGYLFISLVFSPRTRIFAG